MNGLRFVKRRWAEKKEKTKREKSTQSAECRKALNPIYIYSMSKHRCKSVEINLAALRAGSIPVAVVRHRFERNDAMRSVNLSVLRYYPASLICIRVAKCFQYADYLRIRLFAYADLRILYRCWAVDSGPSGQNRNVGSFERWWLNFGDGAI